MGDIKIGANGVILDHEVLGDKVDLSHDEAMHFGALTDEERAIEKKLVRKIDLRIMPLIVLVYLMNYIDRYVFTVLRCSARGPRLTTIPETTMLQLDSRALRRT
jgi:hypothetical protein